MDLIEAMNQRHSVRSFSDKKIEGEVLVALENKIRELNQESGLNIQLVLNEPKAFTSRLARYGKFENATDYIALVGPKSSDLDEKVGYFGEKLVLFAQTLGLNTCWVALTYKKIKDTYVVGDDEKLSMVIAIGYGNTQGRQHNSKTFEKVCKNVNNPPKWFINGVNAALLAPTAMNQQKFTFGLEDNKVIAKAGFGFYTKIDLGIAKYHFELGANNPNFYWI